jgi:hypothetical protein
MFKWPVDTRGDTYLLQFDRRAQICYISSMSESVKKNYKRILADKNSTDEEKTSAKVIVGLLSKLDEANKSLRIGGLQKAVEIVRYHSDLPGRVPAWKCACQDITTSLLATIGRIERGEYENPVSDVSSAPAGPASNEKMKAMKFRFFDVTVKVAERNSEIILWNVKAKTEQQIKDRIVELVQRSKVAGCKGLRGYPVKKLTADDVTIVAIEEDPNGHVAEGLGRIQLD